MSKELALYAIVCNGYISKQYGAQTAYTSEKIAKKHLPLSDKYKLVKFIPEEEGEEKC